jgi:hypothetical protein
MRAAAGLVHRIGRRGASLLFLALLDGVYALSLLAAPAEARSQPSFAFLVGLLPLPVWAGIWGVVGLVCLVQAFARFDTFAFAAASLLKVVWGTVYVLGWALGDIPRGWVASVIWYGFAIWLAIISGWREPPKAP